MTRPEIINNLLELESHIQKADFIINNFVHVDDVYRPLAKTIVYRMPYTGGYRFFRATEFKNKEPKFGVEIDAEMFNHIIDSGMGKEYIFKEEKFDVVVNPYTNTVAVILNNKESQTYQFDSFDDWTIMLFGEDTYRVHYHYDGWFCFGIYPEDEDDKYDREIDTYIHTVFTDDEYVKEIARIISQ